MLNYRRQGQGPTLVLQHGFLGGLGYFAPQFDYFTRTYDVIAADLPGFAGSADEPHRGSISGMSENLVELLDSLGVARFSMLGHSLGGMVALNTALDHGGRVEKLVLYGTSRRGEMPNRHETFEASIARFESEGVEKVAKRIAATWFVAGDKAPYYPLCLEAGRGANVTAVVSCLKSLPEWDVTARLPTLTMPTLVIYGDRDRSYGRMETVELAQAIEHAELAVVPGCAHNVHLEKPDLFNRIVEDFLSDTF